MSRIRTKPDPVSQSELMAVSQTESAGALGIPAHDESLGAASVLSHSCAWSAYVLPFSY